MKNLPLPARLYVAGVIALGACLFVAFTPWAGIPSDHVLLFFSVLLLSVVSSAFRVSLPLTGSATMPVSYAIDFASLMLIGRNVAMLTSAVGAWADCTNEPKQRPPTHRILFRMASAVVTMQASGWAFEWLTLRFGYGVAGLCAAAGGALLVYFVTTQGLAALDATLCSAQAAARVAKDYFLWSAPGFLLAGFLGTAAAVLVERSVQYFAALAAIPLFFTYRAYRLYMRRVEEEQQRVRDISNLHLTTVEALALAIDAKDQRSHEHIRRMQVYAGALGKAFGMTGEQVDALRTAALLHDIGKLAIPEHILSKPGPLTPEETKKVRVHPIVGAEIIAQVPFPYPVAPLILSHHERWDGRGYPEGLKGEEIPLGARILAVIDNYDALVSDRPYHTAVSHEGAVQLVLNGSGKAFDPAVVDAFARLLPDLPMLLEAAASSLLNPRVIEGLGTPEASEPSGDGSNVLDDIAIAHREIYALYEIAQAMGTSLGVVDPRASTRANSGSSRTRCFSLPPYASHRAACG
jgi:putative nucleotidyltransferase with HDIG domain